MGRSTSARRAASDARSDRSDSLTRYRDKRDFRRTNEPAGTATRDDTGRSFCVQQHAASHLHYDFRLELDGVLKSWAIPKGPSLVPGRKRLAVATEDHPIEYGTFEGVIPEGEYGGGTVLLWDRGQWEPIGDPAHGLARGKLEFSLRGEKLRGKFVLVKLARGDGEWLLLKSRDEHAATSGDVVRDAPRSVASERSLAEIAADEGATRKQRTRARAVVAATDPPPTPGDELPAFVEPELATRVDAPPSGDAWIHEIKLDGYRMQCRIADGVVTLASRNGKDWTARVPELVLAAQGLECTSALLDGELVWIGDDGRTSFAELTRALGGPRRRDLVFMAFDLLHMDGRDLRGVPLVERKQALQRLCAGADPALRYCDHVVGDGQAFLDAACEMGLEGIVSKRASAPYRSGRGRDWLKLKCLERQELVIVGWTPPTHDRDRFGALVLAVHEDDALVYAGRVGTGFDRDARERVFAKLEPLARADSPLRERPRVPGLARVHWVEPTLVAEIAFTEWTSDGRLRHPSFQGLRENKAAHAIAREVPTARHAPPFVALDPRPADVTITNPDKVLFADVGITKIALADYYAAVADAMLPHLRGRPLMLLRCPDGTSKPCFFQKHAGNSLPTGVLAFEVVEQDGDREACLAVADAQGLVGTVQMGALELHVWGSRREHVEQPDRVVLDLDPDPALPFATIADAALRVRDALADDGLASYVMSTGGKGLHVVVPIVPDADFTAVKAWSRAFAEARVREDPRTFIAQATKAKRVGKIYIDYLRNGRGATAICPYSTRARPGAPVAVPLSWDELDAARSFSLLEARQRVASAIDPWSDYHDVRQRLPASPHRRALRK